MIGTVTVAVLTAWSRLLQHVINALDCPHYHTDDEWEL